MKPAPFWRRSLSALAALFAAACGHGPVEIDAPLTRGPDHVLLWSQEARTHAALFRELGFNVRGGQTYPEGIASSTLVFGDWTYIELLHFADASKAAGSARALSELAYAAGGPGVNRFAVQVSSVEAAQSLLRRRGFQVHEIDKDMVDRDGPGGPLPPEPASWRDFHMATPPTPGVDIFFIQYPPDEPSSPSAAEGFRSRTTHANTARRLSAVWLLVDDLEVAARNYARMNFSIGPSIAFSHLNAQGRVATLGGGAVVLVKTNQLPAAFQTVRDGPRVIGLSIEVDDLRSVPRPAGIEWIEVPGAFGNARLAPLATRLGLFLEFHQR